MKNYFLNIIIGLGIILGIGFLLVNYTYAQSDDSDCLKIIDLKIENHLETEVCNGIEVETFECIVESPNYLSPNLQCNILIDGVEYEMDEQDGGGACPSGEVTIDGETVDFSENAGWYGSDGNATAKFKCFLPQDIDKDATIEVQARNIKKDSCGREEKTIPFKKGSGKKVDYDNSDSKNRSDREIDEEKTDQVKNLLKNILRTLGINVDGENQDNDDSDGEEAEENQYHTQSDILLSEDESMTTVHEIMYGVASQYKCIPWQLLSAIAYQENTSTFELNPEKIKDGSKPGGKIPASDGEIKNCASNSNCAKGPFQFMDGTWPGYAEIVCEYESDHCKTMYRSPSVYNLTAAAYGAAEYLTKYSGKNACSTKWTVQEVRDAAAAYNSGPGNMWCSAAHLGVQVDYCDDILDHMRRFGWEEGKESVAFDQKTDKNEPSEGRSKGKEGRDNFLNDLIETVCEKCQSENVSCRVNKYNSSCLKQVQATMEDLEYTSQDNTCSLNNATVNNAISETSRYNYWQCVAFVKGVDNSCNPGTLSYYGGRGSAKNYITDPPEHLNLKGIGYCINNFELGDTFVLLWEGDNSNPYGHIAWGELVLFDNETAIRVYEGNFDWYGKVNTRIMTEDYTNFPTHCLYDKNNNE
jgi:hypothetical protein